MSNEKRLVLCVLLIFVWVMIAPNLFRSLGLLPPPAKKAPAPAQAAADPLKAGKKPGEGNAELKPPVGQAEAAAKNVAAPGQAAPKTDEKAVKPSGEKPRSASAAPVDSSELVLGSASDKTPGGYRLEVQLEQKGPGSSPSSRRATMPSSRDASTPICRCNSFAATRSRGPRFP